MQPDRAGRWKAGDDGSAALFALMSSMAPPKYEVDDRELLLGMYRKLLFDPALAMVPSGVPPNAITIFGVLCSVLSVFAALGAVTTGQPALYLASALCMLTYLTCDNVDGPHARRTGRTSALGEFLDHGLDGVASGAALLTAATILRMDGIWFLLLALLGAIGFAMPFWEQFRTGVLVIPELSSTEGITMVVVLDLLLYFAGEPPWLRFSTQDLNLTTGVLLFGLGCYAVAIWFPIRRVSRSGRRVRELLLPMLLGSGSILYVVAGAAPLLPAVMVSLLGADMVCRMITSRHYKARGRLISALDWTMLIPAGPALLAPQLWTADGWAALGALIATLRYAHTLIVGGARMRRLDRGQAADPA